MALGFHFTSRGVQCNGNCSVYISFFVLPCGCTEGNSQGAWRLGLHVPLYVQYVPGGLTFLGDSLFCSPEGMCLGVEYKLIQADEVWRREDQVEVLEGFGQPKALRIQLVSSVQLRSQVGVLWTQPSPP
jgi:hypothetical protein